MSCESCKEKSGGGISQAAYECTMHTLHRIIAWLCCIIVILAAGHIAWAIAWAQYDYSSEETVVEAADGIANYVRGDAGDIINGADRGP